MNNKSSSIAVEQQFILTRFEQTTLVFPAHLVFETLLVERSRILPLPFYDSAIVGCFHATGKVVTLISPAQILSVKTNVMSEILTVICLGDSAEHLAGVGILVDQIIGSKVGEQFSRKTSSAQLMQEILFEPKLFANHLFQPQRLSIEQ
jgi:chemotaxis signal transduction protein